jgi:hypothetical protein
MTALATEDDCNALRSAIDRADRVRWAREGLASHGIDAVVIPLPTTIPTRDNPQGRTVIAAGSDTGVEVAAPGTHFSDPPSTELTWEQAADLLPQLARLVQDHETKQAAAREKRIAEYAAEMHAASDLCGFDNSPDPCVFCVRAATYAVDNPPTT